MPLTELERFLAVCVALGVHYEREEYDAVSEMLEIVTAAKGEAERAHWVLTLGQTQLYFDAAERFLGWLTDDTLWWEPRQEGR